jgi:hypothetical protein
MSKVATKTIIISLIIGLLITGGSLLFSKAESDNECVPTTTDPNAGAPDFVRYSHGFPFTFAESRRDGCGVGIGEITGIRFIGILADVSLWSVVGGLLWVGKDKMQRKHKT